jgi:hypothetical protein
VQNLEHANHENGSNWNSLRDMVHRLDGDVHNNSEKIAIETDWREKGDDELSNKIEQVSDLIKLIINNSLIYLHKTMHENSYVCKVGSID